MAFCIDNLNVGGTELNAVRTAEQLQAAGVDLMVFALTDSGPLLARYAALGIPVVCLPIGKLHGRAALHAGGELRRQLRARGIDVLHAHDFYSNIFAAPWARLARVPFIASRRWWEGPARRAQRWANRASYALADRVLANSEGVARFLIDDERVRRHSVCIVPNFLDEAAFADPPTGFVDAMARDLQLPSNRVVIGVVGSLSPIKDHATLLHALARLTAHRPDLYLVLVGADAGSQGDLARLATTLHLSERVRFAGLRPSQPSPHHLFDISVLSSRSEGLPNSLLEAMAAGRPVVATSVGAVSDAVVDGVTGTLVPPGTPDALAEALATLLADPALRQRYGAAGRRRALERYSASSAISVLLDLYHELADR